MEWLPSALTGVATGALWELREDWSQALPAAWLSSQQAVEFTLHNGERIGKLQQYCQEQRIVRWPWQYTALHSPAGGSIQGWETCLQQISQLPTVDTIVVHPDTLPTEVNNVFAQVQSQIAFETLAPSAATGQHPDDFRELFAQYPQAGLVVDVAHTHLLDPSGQLVQEFVAQWGQRIRHLHISQLQVGEIHYPLRVQDLQWLQRDLRHLPAVPRIWEQLPLWANMFPDEH